MKRFVTLTLMAMVAIACVNTNKKPKGEPEAPAEQPAVEAPAQEKTPSKPATSVMTPTPADKPAPKENKAEARPADDAGALTVDALCNQYGVYDLLDQYKQHIQNKDKKAAKKVEAQLDALRKQIKNDESLPLSLRESFKTYIEDKEEEIQERFN